jgi:hypothetical protein
LKNQDMHLVAAQRPRTLPLLPSDGSLRERTREPRDQVGQTEFLAGGVEVLLRRAGDGSVWKQPLLACICPVVEPQTLGAPVPVDQRSPKIPASHRLTVAKRSSSDRRPVPALPV